MTDFVHPTNGSVVSLEAPTPDKVQRLLDAGYTPREVTTDVAPGGQLRRRTADPQNTEYDPLRHVASEAENAGLRETAYEEGISRDAQSLANQALIGGSTLLSDVTLGLSTVAGFDARQLLPERERALVREQTQGVEMAAHLVGALSPIGAESVIARGASWIGSPVARLAAEGAAGGTFNALQEAAIARDPDVFAERFMGDMGIGALLGAGLGAPVSAIGGLRRLAGGTSAARANLQVASAASELADGDMPIARMADLFDAAQNPRTPGGQRLAAVAGVDAPSGRGADFRALERVIVRHRNRSPGEIAVASNDVAEAIAALRDGRGFLDDLSPNSPLPAVPTDAVPRLHNRLSRLARDLDHIEVPGGRASSPVGRALNGISDALVVARDATPQQALGQLYRAPGRINKIVADLTPVQADALNGVISFRGVAEGTSDLLGNGGVRELTDRLDGIFGDGTFGEAGNILAARRAAQRDVGELLDAIQGKHDLLEGGGGPLDHKAFQRIVREAESSGDVESLQRLANVPAMLSDLRAQGNMFPELRDLGANLNPNAVALDEYIAGAYATAGANKIAELEQAASKGPQQVIRQGLGGLGFMGAAMAASPVGFLGGLGVAGLALKARSPFAMRRMVASVQNSFDKQGARLGRSLDSTTSMAHSSSRTPFRALSPRTGSLAAFTLNKSAAEKGELYSEMVERIQEMQENPMAMAEALVPQTEVIGDIVPGLNTAAGMQGHRQLSALAAALPLSARTQRDIMRLSGPVPLPSATAINEFLQVAAVVEDPVYGVDLMNAGRLSRGSAAALATAFPNFHEEVTARIIGDIARAAQRRTRRRRGGTAGPRMNYQASLMMSRFVGFPLDSTMEPGFQASVTSTAAQTTQQDAAQSSRPVSVREPSFLQSEQTVIGRIGN